MSVIRKYIVFLLLALIVSTIAEKAIPHAHCERQGMVLPDFSANEEKSHTEDNEHEEGENLHASFYQPAVFTYNIIQELVGCITWNTICKCQVIAPEKISDFNILPKILTTLLTIIHTYSSKSPPLNC